MLVAMCISAWSRSTASMALLMSAFFPVVLGFRGREQEEDEEEEEEGKPFSAKLV